MNIVDLDLGMTDKRVPWSKQIHQKIQDVIKKKKSSDKLAVLHKLEEDLQVRWVYSNTAQEKKAKEDLIALWKFLIKEVPNTAVCSYLDRPTFFKAIVYISRRREFDLSRLTWNSDMKPTLVPAEQKLVVQYYDLLMETLDFCLTNLCKSGIYSSIIDFSSKMLSVNYFQFAKLSEMIADSIWPSDKHWAAKKQEKQLAVEIKSYGKPRPEKFDQPSLSLNIFERQAAYFTALETYKIAGPFKTNQPRQKWMKRFEEEGASFHKFLTDLICHTLYLFGEDRNKIEWNMIPYYNKLLSALIFQLKLKMEVPQWRKKQVLECICMFLYNGQLLNLFIKILYAKTNVFDIGASEAALDVLGDWFKIVSVHHKTLPRDFDYDHFFTGLKILLESDHHVVVAKSLILIYNNDSLFLGPGRVMLMKKLLLKKYFWKLFLHWNVDIRDLYIQLVTYKMVRVEGQHQLLDEKTANIKREIKLDNGLSQEIQRRIDLIRKTVKWEETKESFVQHMETTKKQAIIKREGLTMKKKGIRIIDPDLEDTGAGKGKAKDGKAEKDKGGKATDKTKGKEKNTKGKEDKGKGKGKEEKGKAKPDTKASKATDNGKSNPKPKPKEGSGGATLNVPPTTTVNTSPGTTRKEQGNGSLNEKEAPPSTTTADKKEKKDKKKKKTKKEKKKEDSAGEKEQEEGIPDGLEVYGRIALYRYEFYLKDKADFLRNPDKNQKGVIIFPPVKYQGLVMAGVKG